MNKQSEYAVNGFDWKGKKVLVTGASGFKGSWLCKILLELKADVYGITRPVLNPLSSYNIFELNKHIVHVDADISAPDQIFDVINAVAPDVIFHLAAKAQVPVALRDPKRAFDVNIMGTINILEACRHLNIAEKLLIVSTDHVFGATQEGELPPGGYDENCRVSYGGPYDTSKSAMELCVRSYNSIYYDSLPAIGITRAANVFGYGDVAFRRVIPVFIKSALDHGEIPLSCKRNGRQFIHVTDIIEGYIRAASSLTKLSQGESKPTTPTFHFAIDKYIKNENNFIRIEDLADLIANIFNAKVVAQPDCCDFAPNENPIQALNCKSTFTRLGWEPRTTLENGIRHLRDWYNPDHQDPTYLKMLMKDDIARVVKSLKNSCLADSA